MRKSDNMGYVKSQSRYRTKGILTSLLVVLALMGSLAMLSGCSGQKSDDQIIRDSLTSELDSIKNLDENFVNELSESIDMSQLSVYGIDGVKFMKAYLDGFDYTIDSVNVEGDTAQAQITLTCKSYTAYLQALRDAVNLRIANPDELAGKSNDDINKEIGDIVIGSLDGVGLAATQPVTITYTRDGEEWKPASSTSGDIAAALITN